MEITLSHYDYDKAGNRRKVNDGSFRVPREVDIALSRYSKLYRTSKAGMIQIILAYYFGDGANHLGCQDCANFAPFCDFYSLDCSQGENQAFEAPEPGEQTTLPLLDKGSVVVGQPVDYQGV